MKFIKTLPSTLIAICISLTAQQCAADCFDDAALHHSVNPWILKAIAYNESRFNPSLTSTNTNNTVDIGMTGINSVHLPELNKHGVNIDDLYNPCKSIYVSAWMLSRKIKKHGNTWIAVGAYHSETPTYRDIYIQRIQSILRKWKILPDLSQ